MKLLKNFALLLSAAGICSSAFCETKNSEGLSVYAGASAVHSTFKESFSAGFIDGRSKESYSGDLGLDYGLGLSDNAVVLVGGSYGLNKVSGLNASGSAISGTYVIDVDNRWSVYAAPGIMISTDALLYAKFAYISSKFHVDIPNFAGDATHTGLGIGAGVRVLLNQAVFLNLEFIQNNYKKAAYNSNGETAYGSPKSTVGSVALGYKF